MHTPQEGSQKSMTAVTMVESPLRQERRQAAGAALLVSLEDIRRASFVAPSFAALHARSDVDTLAFLGDATRRTALLDAENFIAKSNAARLKAYLTGDDLYQSSAIEPPSPELQVDYAVGYWLTLHAQARGDDKQKRISATNLMHRIQEEVMTTTFLPPQDGQASFAHHQERDAQNRFTILSTAFPPPEIPKA